MVEKYQTLKDISGIAAKATVYAAIWTLTNLAVQKFESTDFYIHANMYGIKNAVSMEFPSVFPKTQSNTFNITYTGGKVIRVESARSVLP